MRTTALLAGRQGFTLLETLIYLAIFSFIIASIFGVVWVLIPNTVLMKEKIFNQRDLLYAFETIDQYSKDFDLDQYSVQEGALVLVDHVLIPNQANISKFSSEIISENSRYKVILITLNSIYGTSTHHIKKYK